MVTTTEILPCAALQSFVRCYTLREFGTMGVNFPKPLPANHETTLAFTLRGDLYTNTTAFKSLRPASKQHLIGLQTEPKGIIVFNGEVKFFSIQFRPNGFCKLFGIPSQLVTDKVDEVSDIIGKGIERFTEQLHESADLYEMKRWTDKFLLSYLLQLKFVDPYESITNTSSLIFKNYGNVNIKSLARHANMSLKSFEMKFTQQVGIPPKLYARITRFNFAILMKVQNELRSWTEISHKCGYYDQMHFIKDFKAFAGDTPTNFYKKTPLPTEDYKQQ